MKNQNHYRQGDVLLIPIKNIPANLKKTKQPTLAFGEVTGHHHSMDGNVVCWATEETDVAEFIDVKETSVLTHQEHAPITVNPGKYRSVIQSEYTPEEIRRVAD